MTATQNGSNYNVKPPVALPRQCKTTTTITSNEVEKQTNVDLQLLHGDDPQNIFESALQTSETEEADLLSTSKFREMDEEDTSWCDFSTTNTPSQNHLLHDAHYKYNSIDSVKSDTSITSSTSKGSKPEIVGVIYKKRSVSAFDTLSRKRGFQIGSSLLNLDAGDHDSYSVTSSVSESDKHDSIVSSKKSELDDYSNDFEVNDFNENLFEKFDQKNPGVKLKKKRVSELMGIHGLDVSSQPIKKTQSGGSLRSMDSLPGFLGGSNIRKWNNVNDLDDISMVSNGSLAGRNKWVIGDSSDAGTLCNITYLQPCAVRCCHSNE